MKSLKRVLVIGEQNIFSELTQIVTIAKQANALMVNMLKDSNNQKNLDDGMQGIRQLEKKSDEVAFKVGEDITTGAVSPNIIDNLLAAVHLADDIVDLYYYLSRELYRMSKARFSRQGLNQTQRSVLDFRLRTASPVAQGNRDAGGAGRRH